MKAMVLRQLVSLAATDQPLTPEDWPAPKPQPGEVLLRVSTCGVCHTELDEIEGRTPPPNLPIIPGHQVVGSVVEVGEGVSQHRLGDRLGVGWIHSSSGERDENLSDRFVATGRDVHGGYAELMTVPADYAYPIPEIFSDVEAAPLLCAGAIGYRALRLANLADGQSLGLTGFGASGHLVLQLAKHLYPRTPVFVFARDTKQRAFATQLGAKWAGDTTDTPPAKLNAIIDTTPAWKPVIEALKQLSPGGRLVINAIRKEDRDRDELLKLHYQEHLWMEKEIKSVANITRYDVSEFLPIAAEIPLRADITTFRLEQANEAITLLNAGGFQGAMVLMVSGKASL